MNALAQVFLGTYALISPGYIPSSEIVTSHGNSMLDIWETATAAAPFYNPPQCMKAPTSPHPPNTYSWALCSVSLGTIACVSGFSGVLLPSWLLPKMEWMSERDQAGLGSWARCPLAPEACGCFRDAYAGLSFQGSTWGVAWTTLCPEGCPRCLTTPDWKDGWGRTPLSLAPLVLPPRFLGSSRLERECHLLLFLLPYSSDLHDLCVMCTRTIFPHLGDRSGDSMQHHPRRFCPSYLLHQS